jgi:hypothetical protein
MDIMYLYFPLVTKVTKDDELHSLGFLGSSKSHRMTSATSHHHSILIFDGDLFCFAQYTDISLQKADLVMIMATICTTRIITYQ